MAWKAKKPVKAVKATKPVKVSKAAKAGKGPKVPPARDTKVVMLKYMSTEPGHARKGAKSLMQGWKYTGSDPLLDGPASPMVVVTDLDPDTGAAASGAKFIPPKGRTPGRYQVKSERDFDANDFKQVSVFTVVMKMMSLFEASDVLGRKLRWAFDGEPLLVVPRAGHEPNAQYDRTARSLQFFFVDDPKARGKLVYSCLSPDIVAHETTHAILDGIAPDLYNATSPQSLAMHEAVADLGAVMLAVRTNHLREQALEETNGDIRKAEAFNRIAQQFGAAIYGKNRPLRDLFNQVSMSNPGKLDLTEPHDLSNVLTGALYALLIQEYEATIKEEYDKKLTQAMAKYKGALSKTEAARIHLSVSGFVLFKASDKFKRIAFRALDYLPPGEISFADYGRAMVAADICSNPNDPTPREFIKREFIRRGMVEDAATLDPVDASFTIPADLDLGQLAHNEAVAQKFAERFRNELMIPKDMPFEVRPRLDVTRKTWRKNGKEISIRTLLLKVAWQGVQEFAAGEFINEVAVTHGTTLAIDWETRKVNALLSTSPHHPSQSDASTGQNNEMRTGFLTANIAKGLIKPGTPNARVKHGRLHVQATGKMLHMMRH